MYIIKESVVFASFLYYNQDVFIFTYYKGDCSLKHPKNAESDQIIRKLFLSLLPVQALSVGLPQINSLVSSFIIGSSYGSIAMAAVGFSIPLTLIISTMGALFSSGAQLLSGQMLGKGDHDGICRVFNSAAVYSFLVGLLIAVISFLAPKTVALVIGATGDAFEETVSYIRGLSFGFPFMILNTTLLPFLQLDCEKKRASVSMVVMAALNISLCILNVSLPGFGMFGMGVASSIAYFVSALISFPHFLKNSELYRFSMKGSSLKTTWDIIKLGFPASVKNATLAVRSGLVNKVVFSLSGTVGISALAAASKLSDAIPAIVQEGNFGSGRLVGSILVGEHDCDSLRSLHRIVVRNSWFLNAIAYLIILAAAKPLAPFLGAEPDQIALFSSVICLYCLWGFSTLFISIPVTVYQALGQAGIVSICFVLDAFLTPLAAFLIGKVNPILMFLFPALSELIMVLEYAVYFRIRTGIFPKSPFNIAYIPDSFYIPTEDRFSATVKSLKDAEEASENVITFCQEKGVDQKKSFYYGLCIEEICTDSILHRFRKDSKEENAIDLRVMRDKNDEISILIRDNCESFDPNKWMELHAKDEPARSVGIKLVTKLASYMSQTSVLGLNVLHIKL